MAGKRTGLDAQTGGVCVYVCVCTLVRVRVRATWGVLATEGEIDEKWRKE